jgi:hypothetical protein
VTRLKGASTGALSMVRKVVRRAAESAGYSCFKTGQLPFGLDMHYDVQRLCRRLGQEVKVIFDVGAHIGDTTRRYRNAFRQRKSSHSSRQPRPSSSFQLTFTNCMMLRPNRWRLVRCPVKQS